MFGNVRKPFYSYIIYSTNICGDGGRKMAQFGFIGMGNMGYAMLNGVLGEFAPGQIIFTTPHKEKCEKISAQTGVKYAESNAECANNAKYIILAVKPQMYDVVLKNIENVITSEKVIISIAPGITIDSIKGKLGGSVRVVRAMQAVGGFGFGHTQPERADRTAFYLYNRPLSGQGQQGVAA